MRENIKLYLDFLTTALCQKKKKIVSHTKRFKERKNKQTMLYLEKLTFKYKRQKQTVH